MENMGIEMRNIDEANQDIPRFRFSLQQLLRSWKNGLKNWRVVASIALFFFASVSSFAVYSGNPNGFVKNTEIMLAEYQLGQGYSSFVYRSEPLSRANKERVAEWGMVVKNAFSNEAYRRAASFFRFEEEQNGIKLRIQGREIKVQSLLDSYNYDAENASTEFYHFAYLKRFSNEAKNLGLRSYQYDGRNSGSYLSEPLASSICSALSLGANQYDKIIGLPYEIVVNGSTIRSSINNIFMSEGALGGALNELAGPHSLFLSFSSTTAIDQFHAECAVFTGNLSHQKFRQSVKANVSNPTFQAYYVKDGKFVEPPFASELTQAILDSFVTSPWSIASALVLGIFSFLAFAALIVLRLLDGIVTPKEKYTNPAIYVFAEMLLLLCGIGIFKARVPWMTFFHVIVFQPMIFIVLAAILSIALPLAVRSIIKRERKNVH